MHEVFVDAETFSRKANIPLHIAKLVVGEHTTGDRFGQLMEIVQPSLGVGYHYSLDDDTVDVMYELTVEDIRYSDGAWPRTSP